MTKIYEKVGIFYHPNAAQDNVAEQLFMLVKQSDVTDPAKANYFALDRNGLTSLHNEVKNAPTAPALTAELVANLPHKDAPAFKALPKIKAQLTRSAELKASKQEIANRDRAIRHDSITSLIAMRNELIVAQKHVSLGHSQVTAWPTIASFAPEIGEASKKPEFFSVKEVIRPAGVGTRVAQLLGRVNDAIIPTLPHIKLTL